MSTIILGLDGMNIDLLNLCKEQMPNMYNLLNKSAFGTAKSVMPALSGPAWMSILTGKNVSSHGFVNAFSYDENMNVIINDPDAIPEEHFYETLYKDGKKIFIMDVPFSTTRTIKGDFLDSYFSTKKKENQVVPKTLLKKYPSISNYINYKEKKKNLVSYILSFKAIISNNGQIIKDVMSSKEYDCMFFQLTFTDWLQHKALVDIIKNKDTKLKKISLEVLHDLDILIKWIVAHLSKEDNLFIISDHGGTDLKGTFFINTWLKNKGYLKEKNNHSLKENNLKSSKLFHHLIKIVKGNKTLLNLAKPLHRKLRSFIGEEAFTIKKNV